MSDTQCQVVIAFGVDETSRRFIHLILICRQSASKSPDRLASLLLLRSHVCEESATKHMVAHTLYGKFRVWYNIIPQAERRAFHLLALIRLRGPNLNCMSRRRACKNRMRRATCGRKYSTFGTRIHMHTDLVVEDTRVLLVSS